MSSKHLRRIQNQIADEKATDEVDSNSETEEIGTKSRFNKFALLDGDEKKSDKSEDEEETEEKQHPGASMGVGSKKRKQKKKKAKQNQAVSEIEIREIEQKCIEESSSSDTVLLKIDPRSLNPDNELRKLLGKAFGGAPENQQRVGGRVHRSLPGRMVKAKPEWPRLQQLGLYMAVEKEEGAVKWYRFRHTEQYQLLQQHFWLYQKHMDHESIMNSILVKNPYHLDSLLLLSEIWRVQEDAQNSRNAIAMGLLACESSFHSSFQLLSMDHRLSYSWRENRIFYLLLHWHIFHLSQRRCFATALQFAKIVFMKDPMEDPLAILLLIDSISLKAKEYNFLIGFYQEFKVRSIFLHLCGELVIYLTMSHAD
ncbi:transcriptional repressor TCF25 domain-containing protein [Ditylenchus destructor]|nr:transcriptional repressor TCF25 domain-containing protein [Ditylenchus destructor]